MKGLQNPRVWDYIATNAQNEVGAGGFYNSFDGEAFSKEEIDQYIDNVYRKLKPYLGKDKSVVEIGCASGITMFSIVPFVGKYIGTDMAKVNLQLNKEKIENEGITNIELVQCAADEINKAVSEKVDIVIINSVCQYFPGMEYFEDVLQKTFGLLKNGGILYLGDMLDLDLLPFFIEELTEYQKEHPDKRVKVDRSDELWISRSYFSNMPYEAYVKEIEVTDKIAVLQNELTKYRYDVLITLK